MGKQYGLPYKGSKSKIAEKLIAAMPPAENFYDLFAGGCAMAHAVMESGKYQRIIINDIEADITQLFVDAVNGKYHDEKRWISREDFERLKDTDPYARYCWSFGNNGRNYLYPPETERFKKWLHLIFFSETPKEARLYWKKFVHEFELVRRDIGRLTKEVEALCDECGVELLRNPDGTVNAKKIKHDVLTVLSADIRKYMRDALKESGRTAADVDRLLGTNGMAGHYFGQSQWMLPTEEAYEKMKTIMPGLTIPWATLNERLERLQSLESLESLQSLESLESLERLQSLESLESLERYSLDYQEVPIKPHSVIYCDIPYRGTDEYQEGGFDHERFYDWARRQTAPLYISEYAMPEDRFVCLLEVKKTSCMAAVTSTLVTEKLFTPRGNPAERIRADGQMSIFDMREVSDDRERVS